MATTNKKDEATTEEMATNAEQSTNEGADTTAETATNQVETEVIEVSGKKLSVKRKMTDFKTKNGDACYNYFIEGTLRKRKVRVDFDPADVGGYEVLDIAFDEVNELPLTVINNIIKQDGKKNTITTYEVRSYDPSGVIYTATLKPAQKSDKDLLNALLMVINL